MTPTNNNDERLEDLTPPDDDMVCINCGFGEWRHGKNDHPCKDFSNGLTKASKVDELHAIIPKVRWGDYQRDDGTWGYGIANRSEVMRNIHHYTQKMVVAELKMARENIPAYRPKPVDLVQGKTAYNEYLKRRITTIEREMKES